MKTLPFFFFVAFWATAPSCVCIAQASESFDSYTYQQIDSLLNVYLGEKNYAAMLAPSEAGLALAEREKGKESVEYARMLFFMGSYWQSKRDLVQAQTLFKQAVDIQARLIPEHKHYGKSLFNLATVYRMAGNYPEAERYLERALRVQRVVWGAKHSECAVTLSALAQTYVMTSNFGLAEPLLLEALSICQEIYGEKHPNCLGPLSNLGILYAYTKRYKEAETAFTQAMSILQESQGKQSPSYAMLLNNLANVYMESGQYDKAEPLFWKLYKKKNVCTVQRKTTNI